ncbi:hypothetical protein [Thiohalomonas denitrificans]|uniref:hypothetical protein n=1 Tax=Thiohalomonas denitrificans TaxID=415747 RepID=UPI0026E9CCF5|nr:hypothetical protein [Thiohalomonas denitrificans]
MKTEAVIRVRFLTPEEGGRKTPIEGERYGCPLMLNGQGFDCRFVLDGYACFELGKSYEIPVKFLNPVLALKELREGTEISLWEGKIIARGVVIKVM